MGIATIEDRHQLSTPNSLPCLASFGGFPAEREPQFPTPNSQLPTIP
ncbi:hypothetical protein [Chamaesiphon polymorphus]|nr:hypothetical protein [Chamaesiphon polymorphus]